MYKSLICKSKHNNDSPFLWTTFYVEWLNESVLDEILNNVCPCHISRTLNSFKSISCFSECLSDKLYQLVPKNPTARERLSTSFWLEFSSDCCYWVEHQQQSFDETMPTISSSVKLRTIPTDSPNSKLFKKSRKY